MRIFLTYCVSLAAFPFLLAAHDVGSVKNQKYLSQYTHDAWTTNDGLPQNSINCIVQTRDGYLWLGTQEGLVRFDGVRFTVFDKSNTPEIRNNYISALYTDRNGTLWIGTYDGGLITYSDKKFTPTKGIKKFENSHIRSIFEDSKEGMWIAVRGRGVIRIDSLRHDSFDTTNGLINNEAWAFAEDAEGKVWIGTEEGISIYHNGTLRSFTKRNGLPSSLVNDLKPGLNGTMWIATNQGVVNVAIDSGITSPLAAYSVEHGLPHRIVYSLAVNPTGGVWAGTRSGIGFINNGTVSSFTLAEGLSYDHVSQIMVDRENNVWVGTDGGGLNVLREGIFSTYTTKERLPSDIVWTVYEDTRQQLWIGTDQGLAVLDHDRRQVVATYTRKDGLHDDEIYSVTVDRNGTAWIATVNGLNIIENGKVANVEPLASTKDIIAGCVITDAKNRVWVATTGNGLLMFEEKKLKKTYTTANGLRSNYINALTEDRFGNIWIGTDGEGLSLLSDTGIVSYTEADGLAGNFIHTIVIDGDNVAWIGTFGGGLSRLKEGTWTTISTKHGLFNDALFQILEDDYGKMWFTSNKGIFHVDKSELNAFADGKTVRITSAVHGTEDGLKSTECNGGVQPAGWKAHDGTLWFPTSLGAASIHPSSIHINQQPPLVVFEELLIDNQTVYVANGSDIPAGKQRYEFHFSGISFANPSNITFKVMLEGYDKTWDDIGKRRAAYYTHLPPGTYTFRVMAANNDGVWSETAATFSFTRQAYFYETPFFYAAIVVAVLLTAFSGYRLRIQSIRRRQRDLELLVEERTKDLLTAQKETEQLLLESERQKGIAQKANEMKTQLLDMVAHDLKTPLVSIAVFTKEIQHSSALTDHAKEDLFLIQKSADRMLSLINDLLNISSIESGNFHFTMEPINLVELAGISVDGLRSMSERKNQMLYFLPAGTAECIVNADSGRMQEAIENIITNAVKYSPPGSEIVVSVEKENDIVRFWVKDNGPGISEEDQRRLFKKFQILSAKPTANEHATGLGLAIVKEIVHAHNGTVYVQSELGKGSKFVIEIPALSTAA